MIVMRLQTRLFCCLFLFLPTLLAAQKAYQVEQVPDPKRTGTGYVSDPGNVLKSGEIATLNALMADMEDSTTAQVAVVVLPSIGEESPKEFATALFNHWGIGQRDKDNGLLILVVMDQRRTEFETGYGLEGVLPDILCYRVGMQELVPYFQQGKFGEGLIAAVRRFKSILENPESLGEIQSEEASGSKEDSNGLWFLLGIYLFLNVIAHVWALTYILYVLAAKEDLSDKYLRLRKTRNYLLLILFPIPFVLVFIWVTRLLRKLRYQPRYSQKTGELMRLVPESEEDEYLVKGQVTEEEIGVADYDVWATDSGDDILILRYAKPFSSYSKCPSCGFKTYRLAETETLRHATYSHTGLRRETHRCKNCHYHTSKEYTTPKLTQSSSSGGSSWSGGSSSRGSSSWGGGRSGGGGSGVSW